MKQDNPLNIVFGNYVFQGSGGRTIQQDVPTEDRSTVHRTSTVPSTMVQ